MAKRWVRHARGARLDDRVVKAAESRRGVGWRQGGTAWLVLVMALVLVTGCGRWQPNTPISIPLNGQQDAYERVLTTVRALGYPVEDQDADHGYLRISSKTHVVVVVKHGWSKTTVQTGGPGSWFTLQVGPRRVTLRAFGELVEDHETVRKKILDHEMRDLAANLRESLGLQAQVDD
jgi:hypothetical protein